MAMLSIKSYKTLNIVKLNYLIHLDTVRLLETKPNEAAEVSPAALPTSIEN
jgi:hypothetical protein